MLSLEPCWDVVTNNPFFFVYSMAGRQIGEIRYENMPHRPGNVYTCFPLYGHRLEWRLVIADVLILAQSESWIQDWSDPIHVSLVGGSKNVDDDTILCSETDLLDEQKWTRRVRRKMSAREAEFRHNVGAPMRSL